MNVVLNLEVQRIRQSSEIGADRVEDRVSLEGKLKCVEHDISLGGVQSLSEALGALRLVDATQGPDLDYNPASAVGRLFVLEEYGEWQVVAVVVLAHEQHRELWERLKQDKTLRSAKLLVGDEQESTPPKEVRFNSKDTYNVEAVEIEFHHEF